MELRGAQFSSLQTGISPMKVVASALARVSPHWSDPQEPALLEWEKCIEPFTVAVMAKYSISLTELTCTDEGE